MSSIPDSPLERWRISPYFIADDVVATANYYRDVLGFSYDRFWGEPACFCMPYRAGVVIMLAQFEQPGFMRPNHTVDPERGSWDAYIKLGNADALHAEYVKSRANIVRGLCDQEYGCRDFEVDDINGYRLCFGHDIW